MIAIIDYGVGNLFSLKSSFAAIGAETAVTGDPDVIRGADRLVLPGVGAFADAAALLRRNGLDRLVREEAERGKPLLGICLGMQLLFDYGTEYGRHQGLGLIPGSVRPIADYIPAGLKIPHIGWNSLEVRRPGLLLKGLEPEPYVYFVHSYYLQAQGDVVTSTAQYGCQIHAAVEQGNLAACQFHPEKSGSTGLGILRNFAEKAKAQQRRD